MDTKFFHHIYESGETFEIKLNNLVSSGYSVELISHNGIVYEGSRGYCEKSNVPGSPCFKIFKFRADIPGHHLITIVRCRDWECEKTGTKFIHVIEVV